MIVMFGICRLLESSTGGVGLNKVDPTEKLLALQVLVLLHYFSFAHME
jgi:hypothetical protein